MCCYAAAHRYELYRLRSLCTSALAANLSANSVVTKTQQLAELYDLKDLKLKCDNFWGSQTGGKAILTDYDDYDYFDFEERDDDHQVKLDSKYLFSADYFQHWELGKVVLSNPFYLWCRWQLKLTKTGDNQVRIQLQLVDVRNEYKFPQIATIRLIEDDGGDWFSRPLVCFYQTGDKFNFGPFEVDESTTRLTVEVEIVEWEESDSDMPGESDMATDVRKWIESEDFGDTTVVANDGKKFRCHRDILARRCEGFLRPKFSRSAKKAKKNYENVVDIKHFDGDIVAALLQFFYTDQIDRYGLAIAVRLYEGADDYKLDRLKFICEYAMANSLSVDSVMKIYRMATIYQLDKLLAVCADYLDTHKDELKISEIVAEAVQIGDKSDW